MSAAEFTDPFDVVVLGGGNAALCAAITAARAGCRVIVIEGAPEFYRGGNTRHTRNLRCAHDGTAPTMTGPYAQDEFLDDLYRVTGGQTDELLAKLTIARSTELLGWMDEQGVRFQPPLGGTLSLGKTNAFFLGGGRGALNALYRQAEALGVSVIYDSPVTALATSLARKRMTFASSSAVTHAEKSALGMSLRLAGVSMVEGNTALTVTLPFSSAASASVRRCTPDFDAA